MVLGSQGVGKTSLVHRFVQNKFSRQQHSTIGASFLTKRVVDIDSSSVVRLQIWDTAGQERFRSISKLYYRGPYPKFPKKEDVDANEPNRRRKRSPPLLRHHLLHLLHRNPPLAPRAPPKSPRRHHPPRRRHQIRHRRRRSLKETSPFRAGNHLCSGEPACDALDEPAQLAGYVGERAAAAGEYAGVGEDGE